MSRPTCLIVLLLFRARCLVGATCCTATAALTCERGGLPHLACRHCLGYFAVDPLLDCSADGALTSSCGVPHCSLSITGPPAVSCLCNDYRLAGHLNSCRLDMTRLGVKVSEGAEVPLMLALQQKAFYHT